MGPRDLPGRDRSLALCSLSLLVACGDGARGTAAESPDAAASDAAPGSAADRGPGGDFRAYADAAAVALHGFYDQSTGRWDTTKWWNAANALTGVIDYSIVTGSSQYLADISNTFDRNEGDDFLNDYYDDEGWWALAWLRAFDLTGEPRYHDMARTIFLDMTTGWDATCGGGIWWSKAKTYKNAIANELFFEVAIRLHLRTPSDGGPGSFLEWAQREWSWFDHSGMINGHDLVNDGLRDCTNNGAPTYTYNQGVLIGGLIDLSSALGDPTLLARATALADASMATLVDPHGVLREPCEPGCGGDGTQFKGIFMRHLGELYARTHDASQATFIAHNADWLWNANRNDANQFGLVWTGPFDEADASRQSSALDALNAAIPLTAPEDNLALHKPATASGSCAPDETAAQALDGAVTTKWCSGSADGGYWLDVDLGSETEVGRVIVRHAASASEPAAWNTRDFAIQLSADGVDPTAIDPVSANDLPVTIHRFTPTMTRHVRLEITAPQTDPSSVAARIRELEVYPR